MIPNWDTPQGKQYGDMVNQWLQQNAQGLGLDSTIWQDFWQPMKGQGHALGRMNQGPDEAHLTHIHAKFMDELASGNVSGGAGYDGPGQNRGNPMYIENAKDSGGAQLGKDMVSGVMEIFGLGDLFKDPTQFGLFKIFKALMGVKVGGDQGQGRGQDQGGAFGGLLGGGGGGGGGGLLDSLMGIIPQPFGALNSGSPEDAPGEFIPGMGGGGGGAAASILGGLVPQPTTAAGKAGQAHLDQSVHMEGARFGYSQTAVKDQIQGAQMQQARPRLRPLP